MKRWNWRLGKVVRPFLMVIAAFQLGILSQTFHGTIWSWTAIILNMVLLLFLLFTSVKESWSKK
jgi:hydrogenase-4 membrane subunit HyfE